MTATNPKKQSIMPAGDLRRALRGHGHSIKPLVQVGKGGISDALLKQILGALKDHELVKVRLLPECPADRYAVADAIAALSGTEVVQVVGGCILAYRRDPRNPKYEVGQGGEKGRIARSKAAAQQKVAKKKAGKRIIAKRRGAARSPAGAGREG